MREFPWLMALGFAVTAAIVADLYFVRGPLHRHFTQHEGQPAAVAVVLGEVITKTNFEEALRDHLFRTGSRWGDLDEADQEAFREQVLDWLIDGRLIHAWRKREGLSQPALAEAAAQEMEAFTRQFESPGDFEQRMAIRKKVPAELLDQMRLANDDQTWIEQRIRPVVEAATESDARAWFESHRNSLAIPPAYRASHIYLTVHDAAKPDRELEIRELHRRLVTGEAVFESLAAASSEDERSKKSGGDLGWFTRDRMLPDFIAAVESLEPGKISQPIRTRLGWHIVKVIDRKPARLPEFAEVRHEILASLENERRARAVEGLLGDLRQRAAADGSVRIRSVIVGQSEPLPSP